MHDSGEEFFLHDDLWPEVPFIHHIQPPEMSVDVVIQKEVRIPDSNCHEDENYNYFGM